MADREPIEARNLDIYGDAVLPWTRPQAVLDAIDPKAHITWFLGTAGASGRPHAAGVGALWYGGELYFTSGDGTKKSRDLGANPSASISVSLPGMDLVFEGTVEKVTDGPTLEALVKAVQRERLARVTRGRRVHGAVQRAECGATALEAVPTRVRQGHRRRFR